MTDFEAMQRRLDATERNQSDLARIVTELVERQHEMRTLLDELRMDHAAHMERDKHHIERFDRIEEAVRDGLKSLRDDVDSRWKTLQRPLWAAALAVLTTAAGAATMAILKGGISVGP